MKTTASHNPSLIRSFLTLSVGNVGSQLVLLVAVAAIGRALGPEGFGWWSFSYVLVLYMFRLNEFGLEVMGVRAIASGGSTAAERIGSVLSTRLLLAVVLFFCAVLAGIIGIIPTEARVLVLIFALAVFPVAFTLEWVYEAIQRFNFVSIARIMKAIIFVVLVLFAVRDASSARYAAAFYVVSLTVPAIFLVADAARRFGSIRLGFDLQQSVTLLRESFPVGLATFFSQYALFFATTFLGYVATATDVGLFSAAHRLIVFVWAYGIVASNRVILPTLSRLHQESREAFDSFVNKVTRTLLLLALPVGILGTVAAQGVVTLVYGQTFASASTAFRVLLWVLVIAISRSAVEISFWASDRQWLYVRRMLLLVFAHSVAVPIGYFLDGLPGVAIGMLCAEVFYTVRLILGAKIVWSRSILLTLGKVLVVSALTYGVLSVASLAFIPTIAAGAVTYALLLFAVGELSQEDLALFRGLIGLKPN